jgi:hypothetical protein
VRVSSPGSASAALPAGQTAQLAEAVARTAGRCLPAGHVIQRAEADADWREFVRPELEDFFASNRDVIEEDLQEIRDARGGGLEVDIPMAHLPQWIHALNQARLALHTQHQLGEREVEEDGELSGEDGLVLFQIQFYGLLQEWMLSLVDSL